MSDPRPDPPPDPRPDRGGVDVVIEDPRWEAAGLDAIASGAARAALAHLGLAPDRLEIVVLGCDDARIAALNAAFRGRSAPTNVLAWPAQARDPSRLPQAGALGDLALSFDACAREAREQGKALAAHAGHLVVHAVLHLLGFDHRLNEDARLMEGLERAILHAMGLPDPYLADPDPDPDPDGEGVGEGLHAGDAPAAPDATAA